ncbi:MAG: 1-acyl-sn-glycerol-3-phosphate acyltransferase [Myxococcales bacterium]|nr:1-acyl-sn-glycerol-3-phosphate acyltransferase [Myxococcales bacterium]
MAAKRVLGNDPFKRGAAARVPVATKPTLKTAGARPQTPELQTPASKRPSKEPVRHDATPRATPLGRAPASHGNAPTIGADPMPHAGAPVATTLGRAPSQHHGSPVVAADPVHHDATPEGFTLGRMPARHSHSPFVRADPVAHAAAPVAVPLSGAQAHAHSPTVQFQAVVHADAPSARELSAAQAHPGSPSLKADPIAHAQTPEAVELSGAQPHAQSPSVVVDPVRHAETPDAHPLSFAEPHSQSPSLVTRTSNEDAEPSAPITEQRSRTSLLSKDGAVASARGIAGAVRALLGQSGKDTRVDAYGRDESLVAALQPLADALYERYWRVTVEGANLVPPGASVLVANHAGALPIDGPLLHHALKRHRADLKPARWLLEDQIFHAPGLGVLWNRLGAVRASPENAMQLLADSTPIVVFPEGIQGLSKPFAERYQLQRFGRGGYVKIAARAGVPIVPVAIVGAEESMPLLAKLPGSALGMPFLPLTLPPLPARWFLKFGTPIVVDGGADAAGDLALVQRINEQVRDTIDVMLKDLLSRRDGVF